MKECPMKGREAQCAVNGECFHKDFLPEAAKSIHPDQMTEHMLEEVDLYNPTVPPSSEAGD